MQSIDFVNDSIFSRVAPSLCMSRATLVWICWSCSRGFFFLSSENCCFSRPQKSSIVWWAARRHFSSSSKFHESCSKQFDSVLIWSVKGINLTRSWSLCSLIWSRHRSWSQQWHRAHEEKPHLLEAHERLDEAMYRLVMLEKVMSLKMLGKKFLFPFCCKFFLSKFAMSTEKWKNSPSYRDLTHSMCVCLLSNSKRFNFVFPWNTVVDSDIYACSLTFEDLRHGQG